MWTKIQSKCAFALSLVARMANALKRHGMITTVSRVKWYQLARVDKIKLELGSGARRGKNGFTTVDLAGADIIHDLRKGIPLNDNTVDFIYASHLFEHIPFPNLMTLLGECKRILKVGGQISVCVPNARNYILAYVEGRQFVYRDNLFEPAIVETGSLMDQVNYQAYMGGNHHYMFDEQNLINTLHKAGFKEAELRAFDPSIDNSDRLFESIYAISRKGKD
jgi:predicted SAM-dependent methyltransferase